MSSYLSALAVFLTFCCSSAVAYDALSVNVYGACEAPPVDVVIVVALDHNFDKLLPKASSLAASFIQRSGCARNSSVAAITVPPSHIYEFGETSVVGIHQELLQLPVATISPTDALDTLKAVGRLFRGHRTALRGARGTVIFVAPDPEIFPREAEPEIALLQHQGIRLAAVVPFVTTDMEDTASIMPNQAIAASASRIVSSPATRHTFLVHTPVGAYGALQDVATPHQQAPATTVPPCSRSLPFDPRSLDPCTPPVTCAVAAGGRVSAFSGERYAVDTTGDYIMASFRAFGHVTVDILGSIAPCPSGTCLVGVTVVPWDGSGDYIAIRATPGIAGASLATGQTYTGIFGNDALPSSTRTVGAHLRFTQVRMSPTWANTTGAPNATLGRGAFTASSFTIDVIDAFGSATARLMVDGDNGVLAASIVVAADATPTRAGLCGAPAGVAGEDAAPVVNQPSHVEVVGRSTASVARRSTTPHSGEFAAHLSTAKGAATAAPPCPTASAAFRFLNVSSSDSVARVQLAALATDADIAHLAAIARAAPTGGLFISRTLPRVTRAPARPADTGSVSDTCAKAFGGWTHLARQCTSSDAAGAALGVYSNLRLAVVLCRLRCAHPDVPRRVAYDQSSFASFHSGGAFGGVGSTEILAGLVSPSWCDENVCEVAVPAITPAPYSVWHPTFQGNEPAWFHLSRQRQDAYAVPQQVIDASTGPHSPLVAAAGSGGSVIFSPPVGGVYTLSADVSAGACRAVRTNVTVTARCPHLLDAPSAGADVTVEMLGGGGFPYVSLLGTVRVKEGVRYPPRVKVFWSVSRIPESLVGTYQRSDAYVVVADNILIYPRTTAPVFAPPFPGVWHLSFSVFDGCAVRTSYVRVNAVCTSCGLGVSVTKVGSHPTARGADQPHLSVDTAIRASHEDDLAARGIWNGGVARRYNFTFRKTFVPLKVAAPAVTHDSVVVASTAPSGATLPNPQPYSAFDYFTYFIRDGATTSTVANGLVHEATLDLFSHAGDRVVERVDTSAVATTHCTFADTVGDIIALNPGGTTAATSAIPVSFPQAANEVADWNRYSTDPTAPPLALDDLEGLTPCSGARHPARVPSSLNAGALPAYLVTGGGNISDGVTFTSYNAFHTPCPHSGPLSSSLYLFSFRHQAAHLVTVHLHPAAFGPPPPFDGVNASGDGLRTGEVVVQYRAVGASFAAESGWADANVADAAGVWEDAEHSRASWAADGSPFSITAFVRGPAVVRLRVTIHDGRTAHIAATCASGVAVTLTDASVCDGQHVVGTVAITNGCTVARDSFETSFQCPPPAYVSLTTPHLVIEYDYEANAWPDVPLDGQLLLDGRSLALARLGLPVGADEADYTFTTMAYENVPGYAHGKVNSAVGVTVTNDDASASLETAAACAPVATYSTSWSLAEAPSRAVRLAEVGTTAAGGYGPSYPSSIGGRHLVLLPHCASAAAVSVSRRVGLKSIPHNVSHVNVTFEVHATGAFPWNISYRTYAIGSSDPFVDDVADLYYTPLVASSTPLSRTRASPWRPYSFIAPIPRVDNIHTHTVVDRYMSIRVGTYAGGQTATRYAAEHYVAVSAFTITPAFVARTDAAQGVGQIAVTSEGVARFIVGVHGRCQTTNVALSVSASCKYAVPQQSWNIYSSNHTDPDAILVYSSAGPVVGSTVITGDPTGPVTAYVAVADGVRVSGGTAGRAWATLSSGTAIVARFAGSPPPAEQYDGLDGSYDGAGIYPWNGKAFTTADLVRGVFGQAKVSVRTAGPHTFHLTASDGCRTRVDTVGVTLACSDTTWSTAVHAYATNPSTPATTFASGSAFSIRIGTSALYLPPQRSGVVGATPVNVDAHIRTTVEVLAITPAVAGEDLVMTSDNQATSDALAGAIDGLARWHFPSTAETGSPQIPTFSTLGSGIIRLRVSHHFADDCSKPMAPTELALTFGVACTAYNISHAYQSQAIFQRNVSITIPTYPPADFDSSPSHGRSALMAYLNDQDYMAERDATAYAATVAGQVITVVIRFSHSSMSTDNLHSVIAADKAFMYIFGVISATASTPVVSTPVDLAITWTAGGTPTPLEQIDYIYPDAVPVCATGSPSAPACPAFVGNLAVVSFDPNWASHYATIPPPDTFVSGGFVVSFATTTPPLCATSPYKLGTLPSHMCRGVPRPLPQPAAAVGIVQDGGALTPATQHTATVLYAKDEPRKFQRVHLHDAAPAPAWLEDSPLPFDVSAYEYEWWVTEAPRGSLYEPILRNSSAVGVAYSLPNAHAVTWFNTTYATGGPDPPISAYLQDPGIVTMSIVRVSQRKAAAGATLAARYYQINPGYECVRAHTPLGLPSHVLHSPRGAACWTPDVPGAYTLTYRARHTGCHGEWFENATISLNAVCPPFTVAFATLPLASIQFEGVGMSVADPHSQAATGRASARLAMSINVSGVTKVDHLRVVWQAMAIGSDCPNAFVSDERSVNATLTFECAARYNVTAFVTDGCTSRALHHVVDVRCAMGDRMATQLPNSTFDVALPEDLDVGTGAFTVPLGTPTGLKTLHESGGLCVSAYSVNWRVVDFRPHDHTEVTAANSYTARHAASELRLLGAAADVRAAGRTNDGDILATIAAFAIGLSAVVIAIIMGVLFVKGDALTIAKPPAPKRGRARAPW